MAPLVQCYLFSGGALVFYVFLRGTIYQFSVFSLFSTFFYVFLLVEEPIEQVPLHKWCPLGIVSAKAEALSKGASISQTLVGTVDGRSSRRRRTEATPPPRICTRCPAKVSFTKTKFVLTTACVCSLNLWDCECHADFRALGAKLDIIPIPRCPAKVTLARDALKAGTVGGPLGDRDY